MKMSTSNIKIVIDQEISGLAQVLVRFFPPGDAEIEKAISLREGLFQFFRA